MRERVQGPQISEEDRVEKLLRKLVELAAAVSCGADG